MKKSKHIQQLIEQGEHQQLDFKYEISDARKIARTFVAFANTRGGKILIGVKDNLEIAGIQSEEEKFMAEKAVRHFCKPEIEYRSREWVVNKKVLLEISVQKGENGPYYAKTADDRWMVYIRVKDQNILANKILVRALRQKSSNNGTYINYSESEKLLLEYLENNPMISFADYRQMAGITTGETERILVNFLALDILETEWIENDFIYRLSEEFSQEE